MNIKYSYYVHKYNTRGSHDLHVSVCTTSLYKNSFVKNKELFLSCDRSTGSCICLRLDLYMSHGFVDSKILILE